jgi:hypothetical protein
VRDAASQFADGFHFLGLKQMGFDPLALRDVLNRGHGPGRLAGSVPDDGHVHVHPGQHAILAYVAFLHAIIGRLATHDPLE